MFLKHEKPEIDDFERKTLVLREKYFQYLELLTDSLEKSSQNIFAFFFSKHLSFKRVPPLNGRVR